MSAPLLLRRTLSGFEPANDLSAELVRKVKLGEVVKCELKRPRSLPWHARYWALVSLVSDNSSRTPDEVHALFKLKAGLVKRLEGRNGTVWAIPDSIAFHAMSREEWAVYWDKVVAIVCNDLLPGVTEEQLGAELRKLVGEVA